MKLDLEPLTPRIGAVINGVDLATADEATLQEIGALARRNGVVFLPRQDIGPDAHLRLAETLGPIRPPSELLRSLADQGFPQIGVVATDDGTAYGSHVWHTDVTWQAEPTEYSILHMQFGPRAGGDTLWSSQYAVFESLKPAMQDFLRGLHARHEVPTRPDLNATHPVVIAEPSTGREALFVNGYFTTRIEELGQAESDALLSFLATLYPRPEFTCRWRWSAGDIAIWNNPYVQHYVVNDYHPEPRRIHRIEVSGEPPRSASTP